MKKWLMLFFLASISFTHLAFATGEKTDDYSAPSIACSGLPAGGESRKDRVAVPVSGASTVLSSAGSAGNP